MNQTYRFVIRPLRPGSEWIPCLLTDLERKGIDTAEIACFHRILKLEGVKDNADKANRIFRQAETTAETIFLPLAHPRFHGDEDYPLTLVEYDTLLKTDKRTVLVYDMLTLPAVGNEGRHPVNAQSFDRLIGFWRMQHKDRVMDRMQLIQYMQESMQLQEA